MWYRGHLIETVGPSVWVSGPLMHQKHLMVVEEGKEKPLEVLAAEYIDSVIREKGMLGGRYD